MVLVAYVFRAADEAGTGIMNYSVKKEAM